MAKLKIYSLHDAAANAFMPPFFMGNDLMAIRALTHLVSDASSMVGQSPQDFVLFCLGEFDQEDGSFELDSIPRRVRGASALVPKPGSNGQADMWHDVTDHERNKKVMDAVDDRNEAAMKIDPATGDLK